MPSRFAALDAAYPNFSGRESIPAKIDALMDYNFKLLEYLRYILRNISPENFNTQEVEKWVQEISPPVDQEIITNVVQTVIETTTIITDELYAQYGAIADLTVDELRTDYMRAARYLNSDTSNLDYIHIHDEEINFITGTVKTSGGTPLAEQLHHGERYFYWTDASHTQMTSDQVTAYPVTVYQYDEGNKGRIFFSMEGGYKVPVIKLGQGTDSGGVNGTAKIVKHTTGLDILYTTPQGDDLGLEAGSYLDLYGLRKPTELDFSAWDSGLVTETLDGGWINSWTITFDANDVPIKFTDADGHETDVVWE